MFYFLFFRWVNVPKLRQARMKIMAKL